MKTISKKVNRYPSHENSLLHLSVTPWLNERYRQVLAEGNPKRIAKYKGINVLDFFIEQPFAIFREAGYFHSTIVARNNGLLFPDPKIKLRRFDEYLSEIDPDKKMFQNGALPELLDKDTIDLIAKNITNFPETPTYYISKLKETGNFVLLVFSKSLVLDLSGILDTIFKGYDFQSVVSSVMEKGDEGYPQNSQPTANGYIVGKIDVDEILLLKEKETIDIINIQLVKELITIKNYIYSGYYIYDGKITYSGVN